MTKSLAEVMRDKDMANNQVLGATIFDRVSNRMMEYTTNGWQEYDPIAAREAIKAYSDAIRPPHTYWTPEGAQITEHFWERLQNDPTLVLTVTELGGYTVRTRWWGVDDTSYVTTVIGPDDNGLRWDHANEREAWIGHHKIADKLAETLGIE
jgi:hypothetical protein